jgi:hypothetical protein
MKDIEYIVNETLEKIKHHRDVYDTNEQAVRDQLINPILDVLGWKTKDPKFVRPNVRGKDGKIPDYTLLKNKKSKLIVEAKNLTMTLKDSKIIDQLSFYCYNRGIHYGVLSNGRQWLLFDTFEKIPANRIIWQIDLRYDKIETICKNLALISFQNIEQTELLIKNQIIDDAWSSIINSSNNVVSIVAQKLLDTIRENHQNSKIEFSDLERFTKAKLVKLSFSDDKKSAADNNATDTDKSQTVPIKKIAVINPNKKMISRDNVKDTFIECIEYIGLEKVKALNLKIQDKPLISEYSDKSYWQSGKHWIMINCQQERMIKTLEDINKKLNKGLIITTFYE